MSPQVPNPGVYYRIQNVDFATFLGVADMSLFKPRLVLRPLKEDDKSQQWQFEKGTNGWRIANRSNPCCHNCSESHGEGPICYIEINEDGPVAKLDEEGETHHLWTIKRDHHSPPGIFRSGAVAIINAFIHYRRRIHPFKLAHLSLEANMVKIMSKQNTHLPIEEAEKWKIIEIWPSLSSGNYRIRGLSGLVLRVDSVGGQVKASQNVGSESESEWEIISGKNGNCMIKHVETGRYISARPSDHIIETTESKFEWTLVRIGSIGYSIVTNRKKVGDPLSVYNAANQEDVLAITMSAEQEISLVERKGAHGQIWIFEKEDPSASEDESESEVD